MFHSTRVFCPHGMIFPRMQESGVRFQIELLPLSFASGAPSPCLPKVKFVLDSHFIHCGFSKYGGLPVQIT